ncbi:MAG: MBL fold metallo-hydrolase [Gemmatimonadaceae bacterium]|nr:MBL fold metallo-hydrolase [Gemmatimonadaceae bacterium]
MLLQRFFDEKLAQASYLLACQRARVAIVVDPNRNLEQYSAAARQEHLRITHVTETHIHADFVSGARDLAKHTGAQLCLSDAGGPNWRYAYGTDARAELLTDGSRIMVGDVTIEAVHTPGHTPEHMTFIVTDTPGANSPIGALTGDFIFVGDVGRPDLLERAAGLAGTMEDAARQLFRSVRSFSQYPDYMQLWPGHGAGSACGKALGAMPQSTLGYEKRFNWALLEPDEDEFVRQVLSGQPEPPAYFAAMKRMNRDGPVAALPATPDTMAPAEIAARIRGGDTVVDIRPASDFAATHARGTINVPRNKSFLTWAGSLLPYDRDIYLIAGGSKHETSAAVGELSLIGLDRVRGIFEASRLGELELEGIDMNSTMQVCPAELAARRDHATILDVRARSEFEEGHLPDAVNIPLGELEARMADLPPGKIIVHCQGGGRSAIAASLLERSGRDGVANLTGGYADWAHEGRPVERSNPAR